MTSWEQQIEDDLDWRTEELASLKLQIILQRKSSVAYKSLLRALWAMLYAHYEGFCKFALTICMEQMELGKSPRKECRDEVVVLSLEHEFRRFRGDTSAKGCHKFFFETLKSLLRSPLEFERDDRTNEIRIKGESNLYPNLLIENCDDLCIPHSQADVHTRRLFLLVTRRNAIAHGRNEVVKDLQEYQEYENVVIDVMHELALGVIESLINDSFLSPVAEFHI